MNTYVDNFEETKDARYLHQNHVGITVVSYILDGLPMEQTEAVKYLGTFGFSPNQALGYLAQLPLK